MTGVLALRVLLPAELLVTTANGLAMDDELEIVELSKDGGGTAVEGSTSEPFPQRIIVPSSSVVEFVGGVVPPVDEAIVNRPVQVSFAARGAMN